MRELFLVATDDPRPVSLFENFPDTGLADLSAVDDVDRLAVGILVGRGFADVLIPSFDAVAGAD